MISSASTFLKYANVDYSDIINQINSTLASDPKFSNIKDSSMTQTLIQIFAACTDLVTYNLQRRAEECYFDTAKLRSSIILLARQLGYVVTRPIPATCKLKIILAGDLSSYVTGITPDLESGYKIQIPYHQNFIYNGNNYILKNTFTYTLTDDDITNIISQGSDFSLEITQDDFSTDITIVQGEIKEKIIEGSNNPFLGQKFQIYRVNDTGFSNLYGDEDYSPVLTRIWVGNTKSDSNEYSIDRRSLINWESLDGNFVEGSNPKQICVFRTSINEDVEILFGDDRYAKSGPSTSLDNIYIEYLSTVGSLANATGVYGKDIQYTGKIYGKAGTDITNKFTFKLNGNIVGGADLEEIESIKNGAPGIYYSLDRLVNKSDYQNYLKTLTSPIDIRSAIAWGEQEEIDNKNSLTTEKTLAISQLFNVVFFTCIGNLYEFTSSPYYPRTRLNGLLDNAVLDIDFDENEFNGQSFYNVYTKNNVVEQLKKYNVVEKYYSLGAGSVPSQTDYLYYISNFGSTNAKLTFAYTSDDLNSSPNNELTFNISMDFTDLSATDTTTLMNDIGLKITNEIKTQIDYRGGNRLTNENYGLSAFPNISCTYNGYNLTITNSQSDVCYIKSVTSTNTLASDLGFSAYTLDKFSVGEDVEISYKIIEVLNKLNERSQVTIKHIYISPIIHNFDIVGNIYINPLYDKNSVKTEIENNIYSWLDTNVNFNTSIYKSNIVELIDTTDGVKYSDIKIQPQTITGGPFYSTTTGDSTRIIESYTTSATIINIINSNINDFISRSLTRDINAQEINQLIYTIYAQYYSYGWNNFINERNFYTYFIKNINQELENNNIYITDNDFINIMSAIHKDLITIIRYNMIDSNGNINSEYVDDNYYKGGYSIGSEICKFTCNLNYIYKN